MSLFKIAWRSVQQRGLASALTTFSMALGVMLVVIVLSVHGVVADSFRSNATLGYNLVVGPAKGSSLQLTLSAVYYLSQPAENVPFDFYLEFLPMEERQKYLRNSLVYEAHQTQQQASRLLAAAPAAAGMLPAALLNGLVPSYLLRSSADNALEMDRDGQFAQFTALAIPILLGDYFGEYRVVGTTPAMFDDRLYDEERGRKFEFAEGRNFQEYSDEHGYFEAVVGARVADEAGVKLGDTISPTHGDPEGEGHGSGFHVVGILDRSGTPNDRAVFVNMEGFFLMEGHAKPIIEEEDEAEDDLEALFADDASFEETLAAPEEPEPAGAGAGRQRPLVVEQREVTSILLRTVNPFVAPGLENTINEGLVGQAVPPIREIFNLLNTIVSPIQLALMALTIMICIVSGVSILVSIYNSMSDRKRELAIIRALGAGRGTVMTLVLLESIILSLAGGGLGWLLGHTLNGVMGPVIEDRTGVRIGFWDLAPPVNLLDLLGAEATIPWLEISSEILLIPALIVLAIIVGFLPSLAAYRTDVAKTLAS